VEVTPSTMGGVTEHAVKGAWGMVGWVGGGVGGRWSYTLIIRQHPTVADGVTHMQKAARHRSSAAAAMVTAARAHCCSPYCPAGTNALVWIYILPVLTTYLIYYPLLSS